MSEMMNMFQKILFFFAYLAILESVKIPSYIHICERSDPNLSACIMESVESLKPQLKSGIPEIDVPPMEPLSISNISVNTSFKHTDLDLKLKNIEVFGPSDFDLQNLKLNISHCTYEISINFPNLSFVGDYNMETMLLSTPIKGEGKFSADIVECKAEAILIAECMEGDYGNNVIQFTELTINLEILYYKLHFANIFGKGKNLTDNVNFILNRYQMIFLQHAKPLIQSKASEYLLNIANGIAKNFDFDEATTTTERLDVTTQIVIMGS